VCVFACACAFVCVCACVCVQVQAQLRTMGGPMTTTHTLSPQFSPWPLHCCRTWRQVQLRMADRPIRVGKRQLLRHNMATYIMLAPLVRACVHACVCVCVWLCVCVCVRAWASAPVIQKQAMSCAHWPQQGCLHHKPSLLMGLAAPALTPCPLPPRPHAVCVVHLGASHPRGLRRGADCCEWAAPLPLDFWGHL